MSDEGSCPNGSPDCEFDLAHELSLTAKIMHVIEHCQKDGNINPCPACLRDTMLAVAALLHVEAARLDLERAGRPRIGSKRFEEAFVKAARERLKAVIEAEANTARGPKH
jgi:hypothetical protein